MFRWFQALFASGKYKPQSLCRRRCLQVSEQRDAALAHYWTQTERDHHVPGHDEDGIVALQTRYGVRLPLEFQTYLAAAAPRRSFMDDATISWWPVQEIRSVAEECVSWASGRGDPSPRPNKTAIWSSPIFSIWCQAWAICCSEGPDHGRVALSGGSPEKDFVAEDFRAFLGLAWCDAPEIHQ